MITVDISNVWSRISLPDFLSLEAEVFAAHNRLTDRSGLSASLSPKETLRILSTAQQICASSDVLVVIGPRSACLGARAAIELLQGPNRNLGRGKNDPQILFAGDSLSVRQWNELQRILSGRDFSLCVISESDNDREPAIAFRQLRWQLERKYGTDEARRRICAVAGESATALRRMASEEGWETFVIPAGFRGCLSVLTPAGLLPMAVAGIDIASLLRGAAEAAEPLNLRSYENPLWLYTAVRCLMQRNGMSMELLTGWEPGFSQMALWWQQLFAEAAGKDGAALFTAAVRFPEDLPALARLIQADAQHLCETTVRFDPPLQKPVILEDVKNYDSLNSIAGKTLDELEDDVFYDTLESHSDSGMPIVSIHCGELSEETLGQLFYFLQLSCALTALLPEATPSDDVSPNNP